MHSGKNSQSFKYANIQNNLAHYNQMLAIRSVVDNRRREQQLANNHKYAKQVDSQRRAHNNILLTKLTEIRDKPQSIMKLTMADFEGPRRKTSLKCEFRERQRQRELNRSNLGLVKRIRNAKPGIGCIEEWHRHQTRVQELRLLRRSTDDQHHFQEEVYNTFTDLLYSPVRTRFRLVNDGTRYGSPLKVEVECQVETHDKKFRKRKRKAKGNRQHNKTQPMKVQQEKQQPSTEVHQKRVQNELLESL